MENLKAYGAEVGPWRVWELPPAMSQLTYLEVLELRGVLLVGNTSLPTWLSNLTRLQNLTLAGAALVEKNNSNIGGSSSDGPVGPLTALPASLRHLELRNMPHVEVDFTIGKGLWPFGALTNLQNLTLGTYACRCLH